MKPWLKKTFFVFAFLAVLFGLFSYIVAQVYQKEIKSLAVKQLNQHLTAEIKVESLDFSVWRKFPNASIRFNHCIILSPNDQNLADTLLRAESIFLEFSLIDLFREKYALKKIDVENARINLWVDKDNRENYIFWKTKADSLESEDIDFALEQVEITDAEITYKNLSNQLDFRVRASELLFSGNFSEQVFELESQANLYCRNFSLGNIPYIQKRKVRWFTGMTINTLEDKIDLLPSELKIEELLFKVSGNIGMGEKSKVDLAIASNESEIEHFLSILNPDFLSEMEKYDASGNLDFMAQIKGDLQGTPNIVVDFNVREGGMQEKSSGTRLSDLNIAATYTNPSRGVEELKLSNFSGNMEGGGRFFGLGSVKNFEAPEFDIKSAINLDLERVQKFLATESISEMNGKIEATTKIRGRLKFGPDQSLSQMELYHTEGELNIADGHLKLKDQLLPYEDINSTCFLQKENLLVESLSLRRGSSELEIQGVLRNVLPQLLGKEDQMILEAKVVSSAFHLEDWINPLVQTGPQGKAESLFPENMAFNLQGEIERFTYNRLDLKKVLCRMTIDQQKMEMHELKFQTMEGRVEGSLSLDATYPPRTKLKCQGKLVNINSQKLFHSFYNFKQELITDKNIKGMIGADFRYECYLNERLELDLASVYSIVELNIENGELYQVPTLMNLSGYMRKDKMVSLLVNMKKFDNNIRHIKFSSLHNILEINEGLITIPEMQIQSSFMDINVSGTHDFDNQMDYRMNFRLSELMGSGSELDPEEYGYIVKDETGIRLFFRLKGSPEEIEFTSDKEKKKSSSRDKRKEESQQLKGILKEELGLFKKDSSALLKEENNGKTEFIIEWEEQDTEKQAPDTETDSSESGKDKNEKMNRFLKKLGIEEEEKQKTTIELEE